ncbi:hypothetical protein BH09BAC1_BH09BAC1_26470 [soil metagenome]
MKKALLLLVLATTVIAAGCNKTIKVKRLVGEWSVASYESTTENQTTTTTSYNRAECQPNNFTPTDVESSKTIRTNTNGTESFTSSSTNNGVSFSSTVTGNVAMKINIKDDGTYEVSGTYSYSYTGPTGNSPATQYSGTIATSGSNWYLLDGDKKNSAVRFIDFPFFFNASFGGGSPSFSGEDVTFDIDDSSKDEIVFVYRDDVSTSNTVVSPPSNSPETNCIRTRKTDDHSTMTFKLNITQ